MNNPPPIDNRFVEPGCEQFSSKPPASIADELATLRTQLKSVEADAAVMRERLEELLQVHEFIDDEEQHQTKLTQQSLATNAGKSLLERLKEAEWLISQANLPTRDRTGRPDWWARRDAFLNPKPQQKE